MSKFFAFIIAVGGLLATGIQYMDGALGHAAWLVIIIRTLCMNALTTDNTCTVSQEMDLHHRRYSFRIDGNLCLLLPS
jgi:hypothetical protein